MESSRGSKTKAGPQSTRYREKFYLPNRQRADEVQWPSYFHSEEIAVPGNMLTFVQLSRFAILVIFVSGFVKLKASGKPTRFQ